ncbi:hypothetical protein [Elioraea sp.]|uniref:hypothetical protein n=1 Tax=Elioraea sp. TaxID=2185103 RepID=UPI0025C030DC|nr:hypothetical protein [Elioraea sp.]
MITGWGVITWRLLRTSWRPHCYLTLSLRWIEPIRNLREQRGDLLMEQRLHEMWVASNLRGDLTRNAGRPVQQRIAHGPGDLVDARVGGRHVDQLSLGLIERETLSLDAERKPRDRQASERRGLALLRKARATGVCRRREITPHPLEIPRTIVLASDSSDLLSLLDRGVREPKPTGNLPR